MISILHLQVDNNKKLLINPHDLVPPWPIVEILKWGSFYPRVGCLRGGATCVTNCRLSMPFLYWSHWKKGHAESAFRDACRTSSGDDPGSLYPTPGSF